MSHRFVHLVQYALNSIFRRTKVDTLGGTRNDRFRCPHQLSMRTLVVPPKWEIPGYRIVVAEAFCERLIQRPTGRQFPRWRAPERQPRTPVRRKKIVAGFRSPLSA